MSQPTLNSSFSGINFVGMNRGARLSYTSLRAASGDNSINEGERLSAKSVPGFGGSSRGSLTLDHGSSRLSQPDVRRFMLRHEAATGKRERLSQPTLVTGDYHPGRGQQRLSHPCLSTGTRDMNLPAMVCHSPSPPPNKHKRFSLSVHTSPRDRLSQLDFGAKYRNLKESSASKFNRDRFSIPELQTQNDLRLIAGTPKQRFSLDSQLRNQEVIRSKLLPIASSPISEHQHPKIEEHATLGRIKSPTREGLESVLLASATPILPASERQHLSTELLLSKKNKFASVQQKNNKFSVPPIPNRERMSVPEIRNSSLRRLLDPPAARQRHSITGSLRQSIVFLSNKPLDFGRKSPKLLFEEALEPCKRDEKEENRKNEMANVDTVVDIVDEPKHVQKHYAYTYESADECSTLLGKISMSAIPKKKYLESNFDENDQVITTVIETDVPMIAASPKYAKKPMYSSDTPKWIRKYLENESPKGARKATINKEKGNRKNSRRKSSLESIIDEKVEKTRSKSVCGDRSTPMVRNTVVQADPKNMKNTYVRILPSDNAVRENRYEVKVENNNWNDGDVRGLYDEECDDSESDDSTSI
ncbi:uncharacterized protein LOC143210523 [Lasioglossum baleicum]|uniref:uncharacterized protein LOC143210523 n=1 Tax=Lasioglossum baleicum TaxID=434251 RepID=UPI003FCD6F3B